ncbi:MULTISPECIES: hypothetical protein [Acidithiobacillus]|uniref:hypothetical protein n=1 Tax=Acidithiobacillus TaxID=119977 RepID=UPI000ABA020B|nr:MULTISPECIES: hypothetical protein [Acidithiobacillus]MBU2794724.1 hypothetical protein [Acidithiobacillus thiooxidans]MBU2835011.1 hypothetical protein [Acidithiobacillus thiooxidans]MCR0969984.1 hypothetical protein [Acidithiobacillus ferrooxidans]MCR1342713.1 hypothetical protein [Acidithiobacillus ferrooxidans]MCR1349414.1 hypothetical protein [Acidithiobacillus ferrooxidans]
MSDYASTEPGGEPLSAWDYRSLFLRDETAFDKFYCPYCDIRLSGVLIYETGELSKSPHFSARFGAHRYGCDGTPDSVPSHVNEPTKRHYVKSVMHAPEVLITRPAPRASNTARNSSSEPPTPDEVRRRRREAGVAGLARPRTYLLQPLVEVRNAVLAEGYELFGRDHLHEVKRNEWFKKNLKQMPLTLDDDTNYDDAFRTPRYINWNNDRIYHGKGVVTGLDGCYKITSEIAAKVPNLADIQFFVKINTSVLLNQNSPRSHHALCQRLNDLCQPDKTIKWYAYGRPAIGGRGCDVIVDSLDYIYIK